MGQVDEEWEDLFDRVEPVVREIQWITELEGSWQLNRVVARFRGV
jgi:hypothetical protein